MPQPVVHRQVHSVISRHAAAVILIVYTNCILAYHIHSPRICYRITRSIHKCHRKIPMIIQRVMNHRVQIMPTVIFGRKYISFSQFRKLPISPSKRITNPAIPTCISTFLFIRHLQLLQHHEPCLK